MARFSKLRSSASLLLASSLIFAQRGGNDWMTAGFDAQRSNWVRMDPKINPASILQSDFKLVWQYDFKTPVSAPSLIDFYIGYKGFRTLSYFGGAQNQVFAIDSDMARMEWEKKYGPVSPQPGNCPGTMTTGVIRPSVFPYTTQVGGRGAGRGTPAKSGVGEPLKGAVTIRKTSPAPPPPPKPVPPPSPAAAAAAAAANPFAPRVQYVNFITTDGNFHSLWLSNGEEPQGGVPFLPAGANAKGLLVANGYAYVGTAHGCNGAPNAVWALDVAAKKVNQWKASGDGVAGSAGPAFGPDGTVYAATYGGELVALEEKTLTEKSKFSAPGLSFNATPVVFKYKDKDLLAVTSSDGRLHVFNTASLSAPLAQSTAALQANYTVGALASWQDPAGVRWILTPSGRGIMAWKLSDEGGAYKLERAWASPAMVNPITPIIVNGVVFAAAAGDRNTPAKLHALDALTGQSVWNSGNTIKSYISGSGLSAGGSRVFLSTVDGVQYVFGIPLEI